MRQLFASCLTFVAIFWSFIHSTKWQIYNYERKQTNFNSKFPLDIVVRSAAKSKTPVFWPKFITKNYTCSSSSFRQKIDLNNRRTTFAASLNAILWYLVLRFSLGVFAGHAFKGGIEYLNLARQCSKGILGNSLIP